MMLGGKKAVPKISACSLLQLQWGRGLKFCLRPFYKLHDFDVEELERAQGKNWT